MLINATGYYCNRCDTYHTNEEMKHRYTIETVGEWNGQPATYTNHEIICPKCGRNDEWEKFDKMSWSHIVAYLEAMNEAVEFRYPLFDRETSGPTYGYATTTSHELVEELADWYCIEVEKVELIDGETVITVEFQ